MKIIYIFIYTNLYISYIYIIYDFIYTYMIVHILKVDFIYKKEVLFLKIRFFFPKYRMIIGFI